MPAPTFDQLLGALMMHAHADISATIPAAVLQSTRANILATSAATVRFAVATDNPNIYGGYEMFFANGTAWYELPFRIYLWSAPDLGAYQDSVRNGYGPDYVTDKRLSNVSVGDNAATATGGIRFNQTTSKFQVYYNSAWNDAVIGLTMQEATDRRLQHKPSGLSEYYDAMSGNSQTLGLNNLPIVQQYNASMGAYPPPQIVDGGNVNMDNPASGTAQLLNRTIHRILVRRMTNAQRTALVDMLQGEIVLETDTSKFYGYDGAAWQALN